VAASLPKKIGTKINPKYSGGTLSSGEYTKPIVMGIMKRKEWIESCLT